jgi:hypothetical protein
MAISAANTDFYGNPILEDEFGVYNILPDGTKDYTNQVNPNMPSKKGQTAYENKVAGLNKSTTGTDLTNSGMAAGQTAIQGGNIEDVAAAGLMAAPNPKAKAAGLALMALSSVNKQKQQNQINKYNAEVARIKARQEAINRMAQIGQSLRV